MVCDPILVSRSAAYTQRWKGFDLHASKRKRSAAVGCEGSVCVGSAGQERSRDGHDAVVTALEATLLNNLGSNGFTLKLGNIGKFSVRHKPGIRRKVGFSGETIQTKML